MATIANITAAYTRHYRDNGQTTAYVEWIDHAGHKGRTEGPLLLPRGSKRPLAEIYGLHMGALFARAICHGVEIDHQTW